MDFLQSPIKSVCLSQCVNEDLDFKRLFFQKGCLFKSTVEVRSLGAAQLTAEKMIVQIKMKIAD